MVGAGQHNVAATILLKSISFEDGSLNDHKILCSLKIVVDSFRMWTEPMTDSASLPLAP